MDEGRNFFGARETVQREKVAKAGCRKGEMSLEENVAKAK